MNRIVLVILALTTAHATRADDGRALLDHFLNDVRTLAARFDQSLIDADGILVEESSGSMEIQQQVIDFIRDELVDDPETEILADTSLFRDQVLDSLNLLALIGHLEKSYAIKIAPSED